MAIRAARPPSAASQIPVDVMITLARNPEEIEALCERYDAHIKAREADLEAKRKAIEEECEALKVKTNAEVAKGKAYVAYVRDVLVPFVETMPKG